MDRRTLIGGGIAAVALVAVGGGYFYFKQDSAQTEMDPAAGEDVAAIDTSSITEMVLGDADAPVTLIEYASFTCPHCKSFHDTVFHQLKTNYIDTGKVKFIYRDVFFDRYGLWASLIARCDGGMRFFGIADMLYDQQANWLQGAETEAGIADNLRRLGKVVGLEEAQVDACMADEEKAKTLVAWFQQNATADEVTGTPTLIIDGESHGNMSYEDLSQILDEKLG
ncbi:DsbA family protein [Pseudooceanicola algae]|uniref:Disulfide bond formation protein D n=1 Tax=Pseudooceanicola algae TaxID=1537215 RepID=A0A418SGE6_9RHOB|nr:DsbA family protein [Pseudooceanicola algae]QPM91746.1 Disulfide bond formation protein D [Pseudooceanicola algae]